MALQNSLLPTLQDSGEDHLPAPTHGLTGAD